MKQIIELTAPEVGQLLIELLIFEGKLPSVKTSVTFICSDKGLNKVKIETIDEE